MAKILHVEDNEGISKMFSLQFKQGLDEGHIITSVNSMAEAMEHLAKTKFDLVISDLNLEVPGQDGADLADNMKADAIKRKLDATPMILLTGGGDMPPDFIQKHSAIKAIVHKPPNVHELKALIKNVIDESRANEERRFDAVTEAADKDIESLKQQISRGEIPEGENTKRMEEIIRTASPEHPDNNAYTSANRVKLADSVARIIKENPGLQAAIEHFFEGNASCLGIKKYSPETYEHINKSTELLAQIVAATLMPPNNVGVSGKYKMDAEKGAALCIGVMLHDYGKLYIPDDILHYPGRLGGTSLKIIRSHVNHSIKMIKALELPEPLKDIEKIIATHHENSNGVGGYPRGIDLANSDKIKQDMDMMPIMHILPIIDRFKAMTSIRNYRTDPKPCDEAEVIMNDEAHRGMISEELLELFLTPMFRFRGKEYEPEGKGRSR